MAFEGPMPACSVVNATGSGIVGADEAFNTVYNLSSINHLMTAVNDSTTYAFLGDAQVPGNVSYTASTFAVTTNCTSILNQCTQNGSSFSLPFNCTGGAFAGNLLEQTGPNFYMSYFNDSALTEPQQGFGIYPVNPFYIGLAAQYPASLSFGGKGFLILSCQVTVYNANYTWLNNDVYRFVPESVTNASVAGILSAPASLSQDPSSFVETRLSSLLRYITDPQMTSNQVSIVLSQMSLGYAAGVLSPRTNLAEIVQETLLVTRVPAAPLYILLALNCIYVLAGIGVASAALLINRSQDAREVQARLSIMGIVAQAFEPEPRGRVEKVGDMFEELRSGGAAVVLINKENEWRYTKY
jgi:hypothetical protein